VRIAKGLPPLIRDPLCDPQTNGGLLVAFGADAAEDVLATMRNAGFAYGHVIGNAEEGPPGTSSIEAGGLFAYQATDAWPLPRIVGIYRACKMALPSVTEAPDLCGYAGF
jgi:hypothetical protein